jgi:molybdopterin-guanine dinucleotide biosynthesis protein A
VSAAAPHRLGAVVLAGGTSRRWQGADKTRVLLDGRPLLDHVLAAVPTDAFVVVVGEERPTARRVTWTRERPAGGGPAAGLQAGLARVPTDAPTLLLAADLPRADALVAALLGAPLEHDARVVADADGRAHWTSSLLSPAAARTVLALPDLADASLHAVFGRLDVELVPAPAGATHDLDSPADLALLED